MNNGFSLYCVAWEVKDEQYGKKKKMNWQGLGLDITMIKRLWC